MGHFLVLNATIIKVHNTIEFLIKVLAMGERACNYTKHFLNFETFCIIKTQSFFSLKVISKHSFKF